ARPSCCSARSAPAPQALPAAARDWTRFPPSAAVQLPLRSDRPEPPPGARRPWAPARRRPGTPPPAPAAPPGGGRPPPSRGRPGGLGVAEEVIFAFAGKELEGAKIPAAGHRRPFDRKIMEAAVKGRRSAAELAGRVGVEMGGQRVTMEERPPPVHRRVGGKP